MSGKIITAAAAAIPLASTGLALAQTQASRHDNLPHGFYGCYNVAPNWYITPDEGWNIDPNPFPVTGQSYQ